MNKITYLFGAGASKQALPIVNEIPDRIKQLIDLLESEKFQLDDSSTYDDLKLQNAQTKRYYQLEMIESLKWMMQASANHASIDTFAKKLFIKGKYPELGRLKIAMSVFFVFEQALNKPDLRYDAFFASLINQRISQLPENICVLSWNYDSQFEIAFAEYSEQDLYTNQSLLRVKSKYGRHDIENGFGIYKINGTTGLFSDRGHRQYLYTQNLATPININVVDEVTRNFVVATYFREIYSSLSFAWENDWQDDSIINKSIEATKDTIALVVIGYSFPFFNREIDRKIIGSMTNLKRVYFQAPDADILKERFEALRDDLKDIELVCKYDVGQFLLPNEL